MTDDSVALELSASEALVLFEFLSRCTQEKKFGIEHDAERLVLWKLLCDLEKILAEPFATNYDELLEQARSRVASADKK